MTIIFCRLTDSDVARILPLIFVLDYQIICYRPKMDMLPVVKKLKIISEPKEFHEVSD